VGGLFCFNFLNDKVDSEQSTPIGYNGWQIGGRFNAANVLLYEVPTYLAQNLN
jgi:hypothetical protein